MSKSIQAIIVESLYKDSPKCTTCGDDYHVGTDPNYAHNGTGVKMIDLGLMKTAFDPSRANKQDFVDWIRDHTKQGAGVFSDIDMDMLERGPSYIELGGWIGDQRDALLFIGLGAYHDLWTVMTPFVLDPGMDKEAAGKLMGKGFVMPIGFYRAKLDN